MNDEELSKLTQQYASRHPASDRLRSAVRTQIALQTAARIEPAPTQKQDVPHKGLRLSWLSASLGFGLGVAMALALTWFVPRLIMQDSMPAALVAEHVRALKAGPLFEVASSDRHTVKPWFQGKLAYAPQVVDLQTQGFPLLGGRVDHIKGKMTAALAYSQGRHIINVFVWPSDQKQEAERAVQSGFNLLHWSDGVMQVWVVSDMENKELERFGLAWRASLSSNQN
jgi:anti-sigma factor RsiW